MINPVLLPENCAPRRDFIRRLDRAAEKQFVSIHSPAGYGKTLAALLWLKKTGYTAAWRSFDMYDDTPALFYISFCLSFLSVLPNAESLAQFVKSPEFRDFPAQNTIEVLTKADYGDTDNRIILIIDDFHTIKNAEIQKSLPYVLKRLPPHVSVFFLGRTALPDSFELLRSDGKISELDARELTFLMNEIGQYLDSYGYSVTDEKALSLGVYTEGWIVLLSFLAENDSADLKLGGNNSHLLKGFFEKHVWNNLEENQRLFLLKTSVPEKLTEELCRALTGLDDCKGYIEELIREGVNITLVGDEYRYHGLFREFLLLRLEEEKGLDKIELYRKTAIYYLDRNDNLTARRYSLKSGDFGIMELTIRKIMQNQHFSLQEYTEFSRDYIENELTDELCESAPFMYLSKAFYYFLTGDSERFEFFSEKLYTALPEYRRDFQTSFHTPFLHRDAREYLNYETVEPPLLRTGVRAGLLLEQNNIKEAETLLSDAVDFQDASAFPEIVYALHVNLAETALIRGNREDYDYHLNNAHIYINEKGAHYLEHNLMAYEARRVLADGDDKSARQWLSNSFISKRNFGEQYKIYQNLTTARAYIAAGELSTALDILSAIEKTALGFGRRLDASEANILTAIIEWVSGKKKTALARLRRQLEILEPYGFIRVFANEGRCILPIITAILRRANADKSSGFRLFVKQVYLAAHEQSKASHGVTYHLKTKAISLSKQQRLILELLAKGHKNAEIVEITAISINTVRYHTKAIYRKLEVNSAADAIFKARRLGLLNI